MRNLFLVRGLPGSGKSTFAKSICNQHIEADMYFIDPVTGEYRFIASKIKQAHEWCQNRTEGWMIQGYNVVVSNTFTQEWEMDVYFELAKKYNYKVFQVIVENHHGNTNEHNVPEDKIEQMKNRFEIKL